MMPDDLTDPMPERIWAAKYYNTDASEGTYTSIEADLIGDNTLYLRSRPVLEHAEEMRKLLEKLFKHHAGCEDGFYACPKSDDYFGYHEDDPVDKRPCYCGKDEADNLLATIEREGRLEELDEWPCQQLHGGTGDSIYMSTDGMCTHPECHPRNDEREEREVGK